MKKFLPILFTLIVSWVLVGCASDDGGGSDAAPVDPVKDAATKKDAGSTPETAVD